MKPEEDFSLTSGGDCRSHWHSEDRVPTQNFLHGLQTVAARNSVTGSYAATGKEDFIIADTSAADSFITLPKARNGLEVEVLKPSANFTVVILPQGSDTVLGTLGASFTSQNAALRFKAFGTDWKLI